jgi:ATP-dependent DNA helicase RecG
MDVEIDQLLALSAEELGDALASWPEGQWFERKSGRIQAKDLAIPLVAFANAEGGHVVVGIHSGEVDGVIPSRLNDLLQASMDFTRPPVRAHPVVRSVRLSTGELGELLVLSVDPGEGVHELTNGDCYLRVGDESRKLTFAQRQELHFDRGQPPYDGTVVDGVGVTQIASSSMSQSWSDALGARSAPSLMQARGLIRDEAVTVAAYLLFADHPQDRFPQALVRILRFEESERGTGRRLALDDSADIRCEGSIPMVIHDAADAIEKLLPKRRALASSGRFEAVSIVPRDAWLEGLVNAVVHRSYSMAGDHIRVQIFPDRIEIESPGRFPGIVDPSRPELITRYARNPRISRVCTDLRIAQEMGEGIQRIFDEMRLRGLVDPVYRQTSGSVQLTLSSADAISREVRNTLPRGTMATLDALRRATRPLGTAEIVELVGDASRPTVLRRLNALRDHGLVLWEGKSAKDPRATWRVV